MYLQIVFAVVIFLILVLFAWFIIKKDRQKLYDAIRDKTRINHNRHRLLKKGFVPLCQIHLDYKARNLPHPGQVILKFTKIGYEVELCPYATDQFDEPIDDDELYELYGKRR